MPEQPMWRGLSRREFLRRSAMAGIAVPSLAAILAACGSGAQETEGGGATAATGAQNPYGTGGSAGRPIRWPGSTRR